MSTEYSRKALLDRTTLVNKGLDLLVLAKNNILARDQIPLAEIFLLDEIDRFIVEAVNEMESNQ